MLKVAFNKQPLFYGQSVQCHFQQYFSYIVTSVLFVEKTRVPEVTDKLNKMNCELKLTYDTPAYMLNVYKSQLSRQTGSRNLTGPKTPPTIWHTYMKLVTKYQISVIDSCWEKCDKKYLGRTDRQTEVKQYTLSGERGYNNRMLYRDLTRARFELTTSVVIGTDCNYHTSTTMTAPTNIL